ncbi:MAG: aminodeoxychorismate/anthranilate synthase component II [Flammeovirgaceae bacterium]
MPTKKILLLDNFDSFTYNLVDYLEQLGADCKVFRNNEPLQNIILQDYDGLVLSPGPETPQKAGCLLEVLEYYYQKLPILGVCLGHQAIGEFFGAKLIKAHKPMHGKISSIYCKKDAIFQNLPQSFEVVRYHSLVLHQIPRNLTVIAETNEKEVMAIHHYSLPIWGVQFHPEAILTQFGLEILKNWLNQVKNTIASSIQNT